MPKQKMQRRELLALAAAAFGGAVGCRDNKPSGGAQPEAAQRETGLLRLNAHTHVLIGGKNIDAFKPYMDSEGITHLLAILETPDIGLLPRLTATHSGIIPFHWLNNVLAEHVDPDPNSPVLGYKIHPRKPPVKDTGGKLLSVDEYMAPRCEEAQRVHRPFLFHSDADEPKICTLPQIAKLAERYPDTAFIAGHLGAYTQEYQGDPLTPEQWEPMLPGILAENFELLLDIDNLYAETTLIGRDYPERSADPEFKLKHMIKLADSYSPAKRKALAAKLFIGTDFPWFYKKDDPKGGYRFQRECMARIFKEDFDETGMTKRFLALLPNSGNV